MCESYRISTREQVGRSREYMRQMYAASPPRDYARGGLIAVLDHDEDEG